MKNNKKDAKMIGFKKAVAAAAKMATAANVNSACFFVAHQPKFPKALKSSASSDYGVCGKAGGKNRKQPCS